MSVTLYTTNCPKCKVLEAKLDEKKVSYEVVNDVDVMLELGIRTAPALKIDDGPIMGFAEAYDWVKNLEE